MLSSRSEYNLDWVMDDFRGPVSFPSYFFILSFSSFIKSSDSYVRIRYQKQLLQQQQQ